MITNIFGTIQAFATKEGVEVPDKGLGLNFGQLIFYVLCFVLAMVVLNKYLFIPIGKILDEREKKLASSLDMVDELETKIANADNQAKSIISQAAAQSRQIIEDAKAEVEPTKVKVLQEAEDSKQEIIKGAHMESDKIISSAKSSAQTEVSGIVRGVITKATSNLEISESTQKEILANIVNHKL
jgi:F-type H+-transporting ATPase subunit b